MNVATQVFFRILAKKSGNSSARIPFSVQNRPFWSRFLNPCRRIPLVFCEDQSSEISRLPPVARDDRRRIPDRPKHPRMRRRRRTRRPQLPPLRPRLPRPRRKSSRNPILTQHLIIPGIGRGFYVEENLNITFNSNIFVVKYERRGSERNRVPQRDMGIVV